MKFFNYNIVPIDEYKEPILANILCIKSYLGKERCKDFLNFLIQKNDREKIINKLEEYINILNIDTANVKILQFAIIVLFNYINANLESVCSTYNIDQGHLDNFQENHVYDLVKQQTLEEINKFMSL
jgi:hypothetical protein